MTAKATRRKAIVKLHHPSRRYTLRVTINSKPYGLPMSFAGAKSIEFINQLIDL